VSPAVVHAQERWGIVAAVNVAAPAGFAAVKNLLAAPGRFAQTAVAIPIGIRRNRQGFQERDHGFDVVLAGRLAEHRLGDGNVHGLVEVLLPAMPGPRAGAGDIAKTQDRFEITEPAIIAGVHGNGIGVPFVMATVATVPLI